MPPARNLLGSWTTGEPTPQRPEQTDLGRVIFRLLRRAEIAKLVDRRKAPGDSLQSTRKTR